MKKLFILFIFWFCNFSVFAEPLNISTYTVKQSIVDHAELLIDENSSYSFEQITSGSLDNQFSPFLQSDVNQGISTASFWLKFTLVNKTNEKIIWVITPETSYIDNINIYYRTNNDKGDIENEWQTKSLSDFNQFSNRDLKYRLLNAQFEIPQQSEQTIYVHLSSNTLETRNIQLYVSEGTTEFSNFVSNEYIAFGFYYGALISMILIVAALCAFSNRFTFQTYAYFLCYLISVAFMWSSLNGFSFQYIWPDSPTIFNNSFHVSYLLVSLFAFQFSRHLLNTKQISHKLDIALKAIIGLLITALTFKLFGYYDVGLYASFISLFSLILLPVIGWMCYRPGKGFILLYIIAWIPYGISLVLSVTSASTSIFSDFGMSILIWSQIAVLFECFMLILSTLYKIKTDSSKLKVLEQQSLLDPLTGIGNRRYFEQHIEHIQTSSLSERPFWLLMIDIDHFKTINDSYGHAAGDEILKTLANILKLECRTEDIAVRWGGEEFLLLLNIQDRTLALAIAERIRETFSNTITEINGVSISQTLSIGLKEIDFLQNNSVKNSLIGADKALYQAKLAGRNQVFEYSGD